MSMSMSRLSLAVLLFAIVAVVTAQWHPRPEDLDNFLGQPGFYDTLKADGESFQRLRTKLIHHTKIWATQILGEQNLTAADNAEQYPYFHWIPVFMASARPDGGIGAWEGHCYKNNTIKVVTNPNGTLTYTITRAQQKTLFCSDMYLLGTASGVQFQTFNTAGSTSFLWVPHNDSKAGEVWDIKTKGIRVCMFLDDFTQTIANLLATVNMFISELTPGVPDQVAAVNLDFMAKYAGRKMAPRTTQEVPLDASLIKSGDFFGIVRLDGLDPMLAWAMGSSTGHTTVALWMDGKLYITESTTKGSYWPTNGIQKTEYSTWIKQAKAADYQVVWAPLGAAARAKFNETAAILKFKELEGLDYGYHNMLWAWIDTIKDNYPCLPPTWNQCLQWEHVEMMFNWADRLVPVIGTLLWDEAMNLRIGTTGLGIADVWMAAAQKGIPANTVPSIVEQDSWNYHTTRDGKDVIDKAMVCCVYVCNVWKAAGIFNDIGANFNCGEMTNWDDYSLNIFDKSPRPAQCQSADPTNPNCQLEGKYTLVLNDYNTKAPYAHMAEKCPSLAPDYKKPSDC